MVPGRGGSSAVARPQPSSADRARHRHQRLLDHPARVRGGDPLLTLQGELVGALAGDAREPVVQVLRGRPHHQSGRVDDLLGHDPWVGVDALTHRVVAHVLDAAGDGDVVGAEGDAGRGGGDGRHGAGAHPVDGVAGDGAGQTGEQGGGPADGQTLVTDLGGRGDGDLVHPLGRQPGVAAQQRTDAADHEVIGPGLAIERPGLSEGGTDTVDEDDIAGLTRHGPHITHE